LEYEISEKDTRISSYLRKKKKHSITRLYKYAKKRFCLIKWDATSIRPENINLIEIAKSYINNKHILFLTFDASDWRSSRFTMDISRTVRNTEMRFATLSFSSQRFNLSRCWSYSLLRKNSNQLIISFMN